MRYNYKGYFQDIDGQNYTVTFTHSDAGTLKTMTLGDDPAVIEWDKSDKHIYSPIKCSGATITTLTDNLTDYKFDLYSAQAKDCSVNILNSNNSIVWTGYITPSLYSQGYESAIEELEIDCIDGLSVLQYFKYEPIGAAPASRSFKNIILHILQKSACYKWLYFQKAVFDSSVSTDNILNKLYVNESVFMSDEDNYDQDGERITDDDKTYKEALEMVMTYMGMTILAEGDSVYILDWDEVRHNNKTAVNPDYQFFKIDVSTGTETTSDLLKTYQYGEDEPITHIAEIHGYQYAETGQTISLDKVYNKVTVKDQFNAVDSLIPDIWDKAHIEKLYPLAIEAKAIYTWAYHVRDTLDKAHHSMIQVYKSDLCKCYCYNGSGTEITQEAALQNLNNVVNSHNSPTIFTGTIFNGNTNGSGCFLIASQNYDYAKYAASDWSQQQTGKEILPYFSFDEYLCFCVGQDKTHNTRDAMSDLYHSYYKPMFKTTLTDRVIGNENMYIVFSGNMTYYDNFGKSTDNSPEIYRFGIIDGYERKNDNWNPDYVWLCCRLKYNNQYWNGSSWQNSECRFKLYGVAEDQEHYIGKDITIRNNIPWYWQVNKKGTAIKLPGNIMDENTPEFTIFTPASPDPQYRIGHLWIKDFNIDIVTTGQDDRMKEDKDTYYTNEINSDNVEDLKEIKFEICTFDGNKISNNSVIKNDSGVYSYLDTVYHNYLKTILDSSYNNVARFEELLCCRIVNQYTNPAAILELTLNTDYPFTEIIKEPLLDKYFIINSKSVSLRYKTYDYKLTEKK